MDHLGWAAANLGIPFLSPIILIKLLRVLLSERHPSLRKRLRLTYLFRDGQYALTSLVVSTASLFEILESDKVLQHEKLWLVFLVLLTCFSLICVVVGLIDQSEDPEIAFPPGSGVYNWPTVKKWTKIYRVGAATVLLVVPVSISAYNIHSIASAASREAKGNAHPADSAASASHSGGTP